MDGSPTTEVAGLLEDSDDEAEALEVGDCVTMGSVDEEAGADAVAEVSATLVGNEVQKGIKGIIWGFIFSTKAYQTYLRLE